MNIQEWAEYYFNKGINVISDNEHFDWVDWRHKKQTIEELRGYNWASAKDIYAEVGKKGIRVLSLLRDSVDLFKNNDDIVSYFSQIENRGKLQMENNKNLSENKTGCLAMFSVVVLILTILLV